MKLFSKVFFQSGLNTNTTLSCLAYSVSRQGKDYNLQSSNSIDLCCIRLSNIVTTMFIPPQVVITLLDIMYGSNQV